jgi:mono/diheme cytochrome c family protein
MILREKARTEAKLGRKRKAQTQEERKLLRAKLRMLQQLLRVVQACPQPTTPPAAPQPTTPPAAVTFADVAPILQSRCISCHATQGNWQISQSWLLASGKVTPGDPRGSILYTYLAGNPEGFSPGNMPKNLPGISASEIATIRAWIMKLGEGVEAPHDASYACVPTEDISPTPLLRLARVEYENALHDLASGFDTPTQLAIRSEISSALALIPDDLAQRSVLQEQVFPKLDGRVLQEHIDSYYTAAEAFGTAVTSTPLRARIFSGNGCLPGTSGAARTCLQNFIAQTGRRMYRKPLEASELSKLETFFYSRPAETAFRDLITRMLLSPAFLYHEELAGEPVAGNSGLYELTSYELAARLSFLFWQSIPSEALLNAAGDGSLQNNFTEVVENIFFTGAGLERTKSTVEDFFQHWMELSQVPPINPGNTPSFAAFAEGESIPVGGNSLRVDAEEEILQMVNYYTWNQDGTLSDLLLSNKSFSSSAPLSHLYGASPVSSGEPVALPQANRPGILVRAATLISGNHITNPAKRGAKFLRNFMCEVLPDPDPALMGLIRPPPDDPSRTTRQRFTDTANSPSCVGCHNRINPVGFSLENYDAIGRYRTEEKIYSADGTVQAVLPIDAKVGAVLFPGQVIPVNGGENLIRTAVESGRVHACVAKKYFNFAFRRNANVQGADGCTLEGLRRAAVDGDLRSFFRSISEQPAFRQRRQGP